ncbi:MAG: galactokinase [Calditrichaeota bacterium]|nr:galactokinase [Calditrichota bacterium]
MPKLDEVKKWLHLSETKNLFKKIYGLKQEEEGISKQIKRYQLLVEKFQLNFPQNDVHIFSTPGRTEIGGNHTDHNHGRVLAASVDLDSIAVAAKNNEDIVRLYSESYANPFVVELDDLKARNSEKGTTAALIRGIAAHLQEYDGKIGGFNAVMTSDVLVGSGLSSSASVEVLMGTIFNYLYNENKISPIQIAQIGQFAENEYFGKPCGLMDQIACASGGIVAIDFENPANPKVEKVDFDFEKFDYSLLVVDTGGNHADLTEHYSAIPAEMKKVAQFLGKETARELVLSEFIENLPKIRQKAGDRAALRVFHFLKENDRVLQQMNSLKNGDLPQFLRYVAQSGNSSNKWLQNSYPTNNPQEQGVNLALALSEDFIEKTGEGACRVHGGGFAGTIQVFLPMKRVVDYQNLMIPIFGENCVKPLKIRSVGAICVSAFV